MSGPKWGEGIEDERVVEQYYTKGLIEGRFLDALARGGDLSLADEFHVGGRQATVEFGARLEFAAASHILDIGCGVGGPSRYFALEHGCHITGIDITEEYVRTAAMLSERRGVGRRADYLKASALMLPFANGSFDGAYLFHVGMNVRDKRTLFAEVRRVLRPQSRFGVYDLMRKGPGEPKYPLPWSASTEWSFLETSEEYRRLLQGTGFTIEYERNRREFAVDFFADMRTRASARRGPGLHLLMGDDAGLKFANLADAISAGLIAPVELICRAEACDS